MIRFAKLPGSCQRVSHVGTTGALSLQLDGEKCLNSTTVCFVLRGLRMNTLSKGLRRVQPSWAGIKAKRNGVFIGVAGQSQEEARPHRSVARKDPSLLFAVPSWQITYAGGRAVAFR